MSHICLVARGGRDLVTFRSQNLDHSWPTFSKKNSNLLSLSSVTTSLLHLNQF